MTGEGERPRQALPPGCTPYGENREAAGRRHGMPVLAEITIVVAPGYEWHPIPYRNLPAMGTFRTNYVRAFCNGGNEEEVRDLGNRLNGGRGMQNWSVEYVYNMLGRWGYPVTQVLGRYRLWAVDDDGQLVDALGQPLD